MDLMKEDEEPKKEVDPIVKTALEIFGGEITGNGSKRGLSR